MSFITEEFMLNNETGSHLYHTYAKPLPILDYHCHLSPEEIATDHVFEDITELWLAGDHYKWRAMRANGISENEITGHASSAEKFNAWAETAENAVGNPLYHWTQLELKEYFNMDTLLTSENWKEMYDAMNASLKTNQLTAQKLIQESNVAFIGTTDSPFDSLTYHEKIASDPEFDVMVVPAFRPDELFAIGPEVIRKLEAVTASNIDSYEQFIFKVEERIDYFQQHGSMLSDHGLGRIVYEETDLETIETIFEKAKNQEKLTEKEKDQWISNLLVDLAQRYAERNWVMQIHFGAIRNNSTKIMNSYGTDAGADSIADQSDLAENLNALLDAMDRNNHLPKLILYNLNPEYNAIVASTIANFQSNESGIKGKLQFGAGWWFNDTEKGIIRQLETLADHGLLMNFVGMITDSRSFLSYTRHEYFRRILCNYIGEQVELGKFPQEESLLKRMVENICYNNAKTYFQLS